MPKSEEEWKKKLSQEQYNILREKGTEMPFTGKYIHNKNKGTYHCAACGAELFSSDAKFDSGTGWPSFDRPENRKNVELKKDLIHIKLKIPVCCNINDRITISRRIGTRWRLIGYASIIK